MKELSVNYPLQETDISKISKYTEYYDMYLAASVQTVINCQEFNQLVIKSEGIAGIGT